MQNCYKKSGEPHRNSQDERLTKKHIETLSFVQELGLENKQLKARVEELEAERLKCREIHQMAEEYKERIAKLQEQLLIRSDEAMATVTDKHREEMLKLANEKLDMEQRLQGDLDSLRAEVNGLKTQHSVQQQQDNSDETRKLSDDTLYLRQRLDEAYADLDLLRSQKETEAKNPEPITDIHQIESIKASNAVLTGEITEANQKNRELKFRISKLERELEDAVSEKVDQDLLESLKNRLTKLHNEKTVLTERETEYNTLVNNLYAEIETLKEALSISESDRTKLKVEYGNLVSEIVNLKRQLRGFYDKQTFKDFVALKRELGDLKDENNHLKKGIFEKRTSLPMIKCPVNASGDGHKVSKGKKLVTTKSVSKPS